MAGRRLHVPLFGRGGNQHFSRGRARFCQRFPGRTHAGASARSLQAKDGIEILRRGWGKLKLHFFPNELEFYWKKVKFEFAPAATQYFNPIFGLQGTGGSTSVRASWEPLTKAGAAAREMLVAAAAKKWYVEPSACHVDNGAVVHNGSGKRLTYGA